MRSRDVTNRSPRPAPGGRRGRRAPGGFTLVEMLIALVITGIMAGGVISLLMGQNRFYGSTDDAVFAEQSLRATSDLVASEVRMVSPGLDIATAESDELTFWMDAERLVVCDVSGSQVWTFRLERPTAVNLQNGTERFAFTTAYSGTGWTIDASWDPMGAGPASTDTRADECDAADGPDSDAHATSRYLYWDSWGGTVPPDGAIVRVSGQVSYTFGTSGFGTGTAVFRNGQELAGPFESSAAFSYVMSDGTVQNSVASTDYGDIDRIRMRATAVGTGSNRYDVARDLQFDIPLKN